MRFTNTIISSVSTLAFMSSALPIGESSLDDPSISKMVSGLMPESMTTADGLSKLPVLSGQPSEQGGDADTGDLLGPQKVVPASSEAEEPFDVLKELAEVNTVPRPLKRNLVDTIRSIPLNVLSSASEGVVKRETLPLLSRQFADVEVGEEEEEELVEEEEETDGEDDEIFEDIASIGGNLGEEVSDIVTKRAFAAAKRLLQDGTLQNPDILGLISGISGADKSSSDGPSSATSLLQGGGPDLSGLSDPFTGDKSLVGIVKKRQFTPSFPDWPSWPAWPTWSTPTPVTQPSPKVGGTDLLSSLSNPLGGQLNKDSGNTVTKPGLLSNLPLLGETRGRTSVKRREAVKAANVGRTPLEFPKVTFFLPDREVVNELPKDLLSLEGLRERLGGRAIADTSVDAEANIAKRQVGGFNLNFGDATDALFKTALGKLGIQNGATSTQFRRSEDASAALVAKRQQGLLEAASTNDQNDNTENDILEMLTAGLVAKLLGSRSHVPAPSTRKPTSDALVAKRAESLLEGAITDDDHGISGKILQGLFGPDLLETIRGYSRRHVPAPSMRKPISDALVAKREDILGLDQLSDLLRTGLLAKVLSNSRRHVPAPSMRKPTSEATTLAKRQSDAEVLDTLNAILGSHQSAPKNGLLSKRRPESEDEVLAILSALLAYDEEEELSKRQQVTSAIFDALALDLGGRPFEDPSIAQNDDLFSKRGNIAEDLPAQLVNKLVLMALASNGPVSKISAVA